MIKPLSDHSEAVLLRSLSVNPALQGKGIGTEALKFIPDFVIKHFPAIGEIVLAVEEAKPYGIYPLPKTWVKYTGKTVQGRSGKQLLMLLSV